MEDVMTAIESVYERLRAAQEENAKLRKLVADYKALYEDMKAHRDECFKLASDSIRDYKALYEDMKAHRDECFKLASDSIRELDAMRSGIKDALEGGAA